MGCPNANTLSAMVEHALDPAAFEQLELHMDECAACRKAVAALALGSNAPTSAKINPFETPATAANTGASIGDRYVLASVIGSGGMGRIMSAYDRHLNRKVALKELREHRTHHAARFQREALLTARLEHPNIVSLHEAGCWPSGEPFYTMRLVSGRPLDVVIAQANNLGERLALLPHAIAVADALAFAHQERIIHRDLKPQNVMVGEFGETVVIDWGLAKDLSTADAPDDVHAAESPPTTAERAGETREGEVMGTPAYMPPEQAMAQPVDAKADVYSIGAILYHLLAGEPPYTGKSSLDVLAQVSTGPPIALDKRERDVPRDLLAIIDRAMARDPGARYPTARELADDLRRFQAGQLVGAHRYSMRQMLARWLRRHRTAVIVAGVAIAVLLTMGGLAVRRIVYAQHVAEDHRALAENSRALAETSRGEVEELLDFMLVDLNDKLKPVGRLDVLDDAAKKAIAYYDRRTETLDDGDLSKRALARRNLGDVLYAQGHSDEALHELRTSHAIAETLASKDPTNGDRQHELSVSHSKIGDVLLAVGDATGALAAHRSSLAINETLASREPTNIARQHDVSVSRNKVGDVLFAQGNAAAALAEYRVSLAIREAFASKAPMLAAHQRDLLVSHQKVGDVLLAQGESARALASQRTALAIAEKLATENPTDAERQYDASMSHFKVGDVLLDQGNASEALMEFRTALAIAMTLVTNDPTNVTRQNLVVVTHQQVGDVLLSQGDATRALAEYRASLTIAIVLANIDPANINYSRNRSVSHEKIGDALLAQGNTTGALGSYRESLAIVEKLTAKDPTNAVLQSDLFLGHAKVADMLLAKGDSAQALVGHRAALALAETLAIKDPTNVERQIDIAVSRTRIGDVLVAHRDEQGAVMEYRAALAIAQRFHAKDPQNAEWNDLVIKIPGKISACCSGKSKR